MSVRITSGIGYSIRDEGALFIDMAALSQRNLAKEIVSTVPSNMHQYLPWAPWGADNLLPNRMIQDIETCGILNGIIEGKSRFGIGQGMLPAIVRTDEETGQRVIEKFIDDSEINDFLEANDSFFQTFAFMKDQVGFNWGVARFMMDRERTKIASFQRDDLTETRFERKDPRTGRSAHLYFSADWDKVKAEKDERVFKIPLLNNSNPITDLQEKVTKGIVEHAMTFRNPGWGKHYYPMPLWMAAYKWVKIAQGVPEMKSALFENAMRPKYMVIINEKYWENRYGADWDDWDEDEQEKARQKVYDDIDNWLVGSKNAHKSIFTNGYTDENGNPITDIEIKPIPDNTKPGELIPDAAAANSEIAFAMLWNNSMTGGNQAGGVYESSQGGSNVRESLAMQVILHEIERQQLRRVMMVPKHVNGWAKRLPGLDFIVPATILTTLDTGAGSKGVITGSAQPKKKVQEAA